MVIFDKLEDVWNYIQDKTFDKLAEMAKVKYVEVKGVDFEETSYGKTYDATALRDLWDKTAKFDEQAKKDHPILFFLMRTYPDFIGDIVYIPGKVYRICRKYFRHFFVKKYNIVKTDLPVGYWDTDTRMLYAIKTLCMDFVEVECDHMYRMCFDVDKRSKDNLGLAYIDEQIKDSLDYPERVEAYHNIKLAYSWFKTDRKKLEDLIDTYPQISIQECTNLETQLYNLDTLHITNLVKSRGYLWT